MTDSYRDYNTGLDSPAVAAAAVTPDDDADLAYVTRALWVGGEGSLAVVMASGATVTFAAAAGWMPLRVRRVLEASTATGIVAVW